MTALPSPNGANGRDGHGRFTTGNPGGPGNPYGQRTGHLRAILLDAVTDDELRASVRKLIEMAKAGDIAAARYPSRMIAVTDSNGNVIWDTVFAPYDDVTDHLAGPRHVNETTNVLYIDGHAETRDACWVNFNAGAEHWNKQGEFNSPVALGGPCDR